MAVSSSLSSEELEAMKNRFKNICNADITHQQLNESFINSILGESLESSESKSHAINFIELIDKLDEDIRIRLEDKEKINKKLELMK
jgi:hypothetical protein